VLSISIVNKYMTSDWSWSRPWRALWARVSF